MAEEFKETEVGERYAQALFELARDAEALDAVREDLRGAKALLAESADLRRLIESPAYSVEEKGRGLTAVATQAGFHELTRKFMGLLARNRRARALGEVIRSFERLYDAHRGVVTAEVVSAVKLTAKQLEGVRKALRQSLGRDAEINTRVEPAILGGLKVRVGSRLFDSSLKTKLDTLKFALKRA